MSEKVTQVIYRPTTLEIYLTSPSVPDFLHPLSCTTELVFEDGTQRSYTVGGWEPFVVNESSRTIDTPVGSFEYAEYCAYEYKPESKQAGKDVGW